MSKAPTNTGKSSEGLKFRNPTLLESSNLFQELGEKDRHEMQYHDNKGIFMLNERIQ